MFVIYPWNKKRNYFIDTLKDFSQDDIIKNSAYYSRIEAFKYEDINENLMKNLFILYKLIINKGDEKNNSLDKISGKS